MSYTCVTYSAVTVKSGFITHTKNIYAGAHLHTIAHHHTHSCHAVISHGVISFPFILTAYHYSTKIPTCQAGLVTFQSYSTCEFGRKHKLACEKFIFHTSPLKITELKDIYLLNPGAVQQSLSLYFQGALQVQRLREALHRKKYLPIRLP